MIACSALCCAVHSCVYLSINHSIFTIILAYIFPYHLLVSLTYHVENVHLALFHLYEFMCSLALEVTASVV
jgi:hypothetical protein